MVMSAVPLPLSTIVQTPEAVMLTINPESAVAATLNVELFEAVAGALVTTVMLWVLLVMTKLPAERPDAAI